MQQYYHQAHRRHVDPIDELSVIPADFLGLSLMRSALRIEEQRPPKDSAATGHAEAVMVTPVCIASGVLAVPNMATADQAALTAILVVNRHSGVAFTQ